MHCCWCCCCCCCVYDKGMARYTFLSRSCDAHHICCHCYMHAIFRFTDTDEQQPNRRKKNCNKLNITYVREIHISIHTDDSRNCCRRCRRINYTKGNQHFQFDAWIMSPIFHLPMRYNNYWPMTAVVSTVISSFLIFSGYVRCICRQPPFITTNDTKNCVLACWESAATAVGT